MKKRLADLVEMMALLLLMTMMTVCDHEKNRQLTMPMRQPNRVISGKEVQVKIWAPMCPKKGRHHPKIVKKASTEREQRRKTLGIWAKKLLRKTGKKLTSEEMKPEMLSPVNSAKDQPNLPKMMAISGQNRHVPKLSVRKSENDKLSLKLCRKCPWPHHWDIQWNPLTVMGMKRQ